MRKLLALAVIALLASCAATRESAAPTAPASFVVHELRDADYDIQGCATMLRRVSGGGDVFAEDAVETGARGLIRIDDTLIRVSLVSATGGEEGGVRTFASPDGAVRVVETYRMGKSHPQSDSVDMSGHLTVTYRGAAQSLAVTGGTAC